MLLNYKYRGHHLRYSNKLEATGEGLDAQRIHSVSLE